MPERNEFQHSIVGYVHRYIFLFKHIYKFGSLNFKYPPIVIKNCITLIITLGFQHPPTDRLPVCGVLQFPLAYGHHCHGFLRQRLPLPLPELPLWPASLLDLPPPFWPFQRWRVSSGYPQLCRMVYRKKMEKMSSKWDHL